MPSWAWLSARPDQGAVRFYCNGHNWLARKLTANGIGYTMADNAFVGIDDWPRAQAMADTLSPEQLHRASTLCYPVAEIFGQDYHTCVRYCLVAIAAILHSSQRWMTSPPRSALWRGLTKQPEIQGRTVKGLNFFASDVQTLLHAVQDPRGNIAGFRRGDLDGRSGHILADAAVAATAQAARHRGDQARRENLPLLPDQGGACRHRCGGTINRGGYCSNTDSMGLLPSCHSTQNLPRVGW
jgi:hypothetical protein